MYHLLKESLIFEHICHLIYTQLKSIGNGVEVTLQYKQTHMEVKFSLQHIKDIPQTQILVVNIMGYTDDHHQD